MTGILMAVDLDGTLLAGNSLHAYIRSGFRCGGIGVKLRLAAILALRRLKLISHLTMKRRALAAICPGERLRSDFVSRVRPLVRPEVMSLIERHRAAGGAVLLATAAAGGYVSWIWEGDFVATDPAARVECRGEEKLRRVLAFAGSRGLRLGVVVTDHPDDLPLLRHPGTRRILVAPKDPALPHDEIIC